MSFKRASSGIARKSLASEAGRAVDFISLGVGRRRPCETAFAEPLAQRDPHEQERPEGGGRADGSRKGDVERAGKATFDDLESNIAPAFLKAGSVMAILSAAERSSSEVQPKAASTSPCRIRDCPIARHRPQAGVGHSALFPGVVPHNLIRANWLVVLM